MRITNFETTGLDRIHNFLGKIPAGTPALKEMLKSVNFTFIVEGIDRVQSTLLCELGLSYVQQSQRYVTMGEDGYVMPDVSPQYIDEGKSLIESAFQLYAEMTEKNPGEITKGRPKNEAYKYGIPIEDARYIIPMAAKTNISIAGSGDKLVDLFDLAGDYRYYNIMRNFISTLKKFLPHWLVRTLENPHHANLEIVDAFYNETYFQHITYDKKLVLFDSFGKPLLRVARGAITSTASGSPADISKGWSKEYPTELVNRVLKYGHTGICEQQRTLFGMMLSMSAYHQQIRHRLPEMVRENLMEIINDVRRDVIIPETIKNSPFYERYMALVQRFKDYRFEVSQTHDEDGIYPFLLNCDMVKFTISTNARIDEWMLKERTCMTAQWEIREVSTDKVIELRELSDILYDKAIPPCVHGKCKEDAMTCGKSQDVKTIFTKLQEE